MIQSKCKHTETHKKGSNAFLSKTTCRLCNKVVKNEKLNPNAKTGATASNASETRSTRSPTTPIPSPATPMSSNGETDSENQTDYQEFQKYLRWKNLRVLPKAYPKGPTKEEQ